MEKQTPGTPLPFVLANNFRQLGGYPAWRGRVVRDGCFYRTGALALIQNPEDKARFAQLGIRAVFDFRSEQERDQMPDPAFEGVRYCPCSALVAMGGGEVNFDLDSMLNGSVEEAAKAIPNMNLFYRELPLNNPAYRAMFRAICEGETPLLFHCTAGKDRTGVAAALILTMLGVSRDDVMADYLHSNNCRGDAVTRVKARYAAAIRRDPRMEQVIDDLMGVKREYLEAAFAAIEQEYPAFEAYLNGEYGIDAGKLEELRLRYTTEQQ